MKGVVLDDTGAPVLGATVLVAGTNKGTTTGVNGDFVLSGVPANAKGLQVSYIGYETQTVAVARDVKVMLKSDAQQIEEVVVTGMTVNLWLKIFF